MEIPFQFDALLLFGFLGTMLLVGILLRAQVRFFQRFLIPSCLIGGALGLILLSTGIVKADVNRIENFAYHFFNISFISIGLTRSYELEQLKISDYFKGAFWMSMTQSLSFVLQAIVGALIVLFLGLLGMKLFVTFGFLLPMGFEEGPGQALSFGKVWESAGFEHGATIGLTFAAVGFIFSFFVGVPIANWGIKKGYSSQTPAALPRYFISGYFRSEEQSESAGELTTHSSNIETLAFHTALIGLVYILTYALVYGIASLLAPDVGKMLWGFFFFFGLVVAFLVRLVMSLLKIDSLINPGIQRRITGWSVDFLIVSTVMAIKLVVVWKYIVPIALMCLIGGGLTTWLVIHLGRRLPEYNLERSIAIYGAVTGTVSSGLLLLRIVDPEFKTPVGIEIGFMNLIMVPIIMSYGILVNSPLWWKWPLILTTAVFFLAGLTSILLMYLIKMYGHKKF